MEPDPRAEAREAAKAQDSADAPRKTTSERHGRKPWKLKTARPNHPPGNPEAAASGGAARVVAAVAAGAEANAWARARGRDESLCDLGGT